MPRSLKRSRKINRKKPRRKSPRRRLRAGAFVGSGQQSCIVSTANPSRVLSISLFEAKDVAREADTEMEITRILREEDPEQTRFVSSDDFRTLTMDDFRIFYPAEARDYENECPFQGELPETVMISTRLRCDPLGDLTPADMAYLEASIEILKKRDISHGDIHNKNIMRRDGRPVLIDWGLSRMNAKDKGDKDEKFLKAARIQNMGEKQERTRREELARARAEMEAERQAERAQQPEDEPPIRKMRFM